MFSVGASPFNSRSRQLYGGWTLDEAGRDPWAMRQWYLMSSKYNPDENERKTARAWLRAYRELPLGTRKAFTKEGRKYWNLAIKPGLSAEQKQAIWDLWQATPLSDSNPTTQFVSSLLRHAPFPSTRSLNMYPNLTAPLSIKTDAIPDLDAATWPTQYRTFANMWEAARATGRARRQARRTAAMNDILASIAGPAPALPADVGVPPPLPNSAAIRELGLDPSRIRGLLRAERAAARAAARARAAVAEQGMADEGDIVVPA